MGLVSLLFVLINFGNSFINTDYNTKRCSRKESYMTEGHTQYRAMYFCCGNHETIGNNCQECDVGFTSLNGDKCKKCKRGAYGKRCLELCECITDQWCDHILGCVHNLEESSHEKSLWTTDYMIKNYETTPDLSGKHGGKCLSDVKVVVSALVGLLMGFGVGVMIMFVKKSIQRKNKSDLTIAESTVSFESQQPEPVNAYEEINDIISVSHDADINRNDEHSDTSNPSVNTERSSQNSQHTDYLNPYQSIIPCTDHHLYMTTATSLDSDTCSTNQFVTEAYSSPFSESGKTEGSNKNYSGSCISRQLNYVELQMNTSIQAKNNVSDKYVSTCILADQPNQDQPSTQKTQYAEITHTV